jgi:hypothetical protein
VHLPGPWKGTRNTCSSFCAPYLQILNEKLLTGVNNGQVSQV